MSSRRPPKDHIPFHLGASNNGSFIHCIIQWTSVTMLIIEPKEAKKEVQSQEAPCRTSLSVLAKHVRGGPFYRWRN